MSKVLDPSSKRQAMSTRTEARQMLWEVAGPPGMHDNRKSWLTRAARLMGWGQRRTKAIFYCEARIITADEWRTLHQRLDALKTNEKRHGEQINELCAFSRMDRLEATMAGRDCISLGGGAAATSGAEPGQDDPAARRPVRLAR